MHCWKRDLDLLIFVRMRNSLSFLKTCLFHQNKPTQRVASTTCLHFYPTTRSYSNESDAKIPIQYKSHGIVDGRLSPETRSQSHDPPPGDGHVLEQYPRIQLQKGVIDYKTFRDRYNYLRRDESAAEEVVVRGALCNEICLTLLHAHTLKEEYGHIVLQVPSSHLSISSKMTV